jgi:uridine phosphorylase
MTHLRPHAEVAERVLLPGDPGRALRLAQQLVDAPKMLNHNRGLWGYTGLAPDGEPLTIQSTGLGGPSTAIVVEELISLGARRLVRLGTGAAVDGALALGSLVIADAVQADDGASRALGARSPLAADPELLAALRAAASEAVTSREARGSGAVTGTVASTDLVYGALTAPAGAIAADLSTGALFAVAARRGARAACVLAISEAQGRRIEPEALDAAEAELGRVGAAALG